MIESAVTLVNVKLPDLKKGLRYEPYQFAKWTHPDDLKGLYQVQKMEPGGHLFFTYDVITTNSNIKFREWMKFRLDPRKSFYLSDPVHKGKITRIQKLILAKKQLYLSFLSEQWDVEEGHHRLIAAALLGATKFPVMFVRYVPPSM